MYSGLCLQTNERQNVLYVQGLNIYLPYTPFLRKILEGDEAQEMRSNSGEEKGRPRTSDLQEASVATSLGFSGRMEDSGRNMESAEFYVYLWYLENNVDRSLTSLLDFWKRNKAIINCSKSTVQEKIQSWDILSSRRNNPCM